MPPNVASVNPTGEPFEEGSGSNILANAGRQNTQAAYGKKYPKKIVWRNVILFLMLHISALYGLYLSFTSAKIATVLYAYVLHMLGGLGITAGAHRLWSHKSYRAKWPLKFFLMLCNTLAFQNSIWEWARDHRVHHKYSETDADPHNAKNGMFFSHIGWLLVKKHPDVISKGKAIDLSDLESDPIVAFQKKYYLIMMPLICFILPTFVPVYSWNETWSNAIFVSTLLRYTVTLNVTWLVNSVAHFFGAKPYDKEINPAENLFVALGALGEGWHNYHHVFPWDYKTAEIGNYRANFTTFFIDLMAKLGLAYDMKTVSPSVIMKRAERTGDGSYVPLKQYEKMFKTIDQHTHEGGVWGWDDSDLTSEDRESAVVINNTSESKLD